ncbi:hypothetical protein POM88_007455 [Heracleum sosnowskyi]|uniref:Uncharacterized protein n=1 Tax=Heracleum sosnowskyi TaxID=360622 RepID=A0AAD8N694_9APIA|nr:hypothetical protein POM88_007455 [Heracleum sosnowskyi]
MFIGGRIPHTSRHSTQFYTPGKEEGRRRRKIRWEKEREGGEDEKEVESRRRDAGSIEKLSSLLFFCLNSGNSERRKTLHLKVSCLSRKLKLKREMRLKAFWSRPNKNKKESDEIVKTSYLQEPKQCNDFLLKLWEFERSCQFH